MSWQYPADRVERTALTRIEIPQAIWKEDYFFEAWR
jgi:hypothetical protein